MTDETKTPPESARRLHKLLLVGVLVALLGVSGAAAADDAVLAEAAQQIRLRLEPPASADALVVAGQPMRAVVALPAFYASRLYEPAWVGGPDERLDGLLRALGRAELHGLRSFDYHLPTLRELRVRLRTDRSAGVLGDLDLLLTDGLLIYAGHLVSGRVDPATFDSEWFANRQEVDLVVWAASAAASDRPAEMLDQLLPDNPGYGHLRRALTAYRDMEPWPIPAPFPAAGTKLEPGAEGPRVLELRLRLSADDIVGIAGEGDSMGEGEIGPASAVFDAELEAAVRRFQARHGLGVDGVVGQKTLDALRVPLPARIRQIEINLERWRWLPRDLGARHLIVNIPEFVLRAVDHGDVVLEMAAVVGREHRHTPVMSDRVRYLVLNPFWEVPPNIAVQDKLPEIRKDAGFLQREGFQVLSGWGSEERSVDPAGVDWSQVSRANFVYRLRQSPGPRNALGRVKFMFPNRFNVYIHDTPTREVFARPERAVSSGCIRVEKPVDLAEYLLRGGDWNRARLDAAIASGQTRTVSLPEPLPVHIEYWTAWVGDDGTVQFRRDVYGRDATLSAALAEAPPVAVGTAR